MQYLALLELRDGNTLTMEGDGKNQAISRLLDAVEYDEPMPYIVHVYEHRNTYTIDRTD